MLTSTACRRRWCSLMSALFDKKWNEHQYQTKNCLFLQCKGLRNIFLRREWVVSLILCPCICYVFLLWLLFCAALFSQVISQSFHQRGELIKWGGPMRKLPESGTLTTWRCPCSFHYLPQNICPEKQYACVPNMFVEVKMCYNAWVRKTLW